MPSSESPSRRRQALYAGALLIASSAVGILLIEAGFRVAHVPVGTVQINRRTVQRSVNERLHFELRPDSVAQAEVEYRINGVGMRNPDVRLAKPPGVRRVAVLGDSIAFGYWVAEKDAFPRQLESLLAEGGFGSVEVLNFAVPGYNLDQEIETLRTRVLPYAPDLVIVALCLNDLEDVFSYEYGLTMNRGQRERTALGRVSEFLLEHSHLFSWIEYRRAELEARRTFARMKNPLRGPFYQEAVDKQRARLVASFGEIAQLLAPSRVPALVVVFPTMGNRFVNYPYADLHGAVTGAARESGLPALDLLDCFKAYDFWDVRVDVLHPSPLGHRVAAHAVRDELCVRGLLPCRIDLALGLCAEYRKGDFPTVRGY